MMRKRLLCAILALVLLISAQPAMASSNKRSTIFELTTRMPVIRVTVPAYGEVYINPLGLTVYVGEGYSSAEIITVDSSLANWSDVQLQMDVTVTSSVKPDSSMSLASSPTKGEGTDKRAFIYFEIVQVSDPYYAKWEKTYDPDKHIALVNGGAVSKTNVMILPARDMDGSVAKGGYAAFRLTGDLVKRPTVPWNAIDGVNVTIAFTFTPIPYV